MEEEEAEKLCSSVRVFDVNFADCLIRAPGPRPRATGPAIAIAIASTESIAKLSLCNN